jgi:transcriptional regulator with XRE-family HTH domain|nr:MAG TPA_asm: helix-turn-helix protein [Caudoviricetes sp.]
MRTEFIAERKRELKLTNQMISDSTGIALSTLDKITSGANTNPKLDTLQELAKVLQCTLDDFADEPAGTQQQPPQPSVSPDAIKVALDYDALDYRGKYAVRSVLDAESAYLKRVSAEDYHTPEMNQKRDALRSMQDQKAQ